MGPRSDNRGYAEYAAGRMDGDDALQWVRGLITAVMRDPAADTGGVGILQWVRGLITAVMSEAHVQTHGAVVLQWVRGLITAVMPFEEGA